MLDERSECLPKASVESHSWRHHPQAIVMACLGRSKWLQREPWSRQAICKLTMRWLDLIWLETCNDVPSAVVRSNLSRTMDGEVLSALGYCCAGPYISGQKWPCRPRGMRCCSQMVATGPFEKSAASSTCRNPDDLRLPKASNSSTVAFIFSRRTAV